MLHGIKAMLHGIKAMLHGIKAMLHGVKTILCCSSCLFPLTNHKHKQESPKKATLSYAGNQI